MPVELAWSKGEKNPECEAEGEDETTADPLREGCLVCWPWEVDEEMDAVGVSDLVGGVEVRVGSGAATAGETGAGASSSGSVGRMVAVSLNEVGILSRKPGERRPSGLLSSSSSSAACAAESRGSAGLAGSAVVVVVVAAVVSSVGVSYGFDVEKASVGGVVLSNASVEDWAYGFAHGSGEFDRFAKGSAKGLSSKA
ncbi:hypothetical protein BDQ12DRAFT_512188 [Crucibulum laeve]|uniref:Uncharacterized protein n=1 Tax=Crucibulum laeve TaxID=68775 RepID=A0A5C3M611_9AGAR|nr:hypothetical protein BDQ12DRAFT_512188 [Crucibulum laeve]